MSLYGCHSKPVGHGYWARTVWHGDGKSSPSDGWTYVVNTMSRECRYDKQRDDPKCEGCSRIVK